MKVKSTKDKSCCILCLMTQLNGYSHLTFSLASLSLAAHAQLSPFTSMGALSTAKQPCGQPMKTPDGNTPLNTHSPPQTMSRCWGAHQDVVCGTQE